MFRRALIAMLMAAFMLSVAGCHSKKKANSPLSHINSKQPDKVLYDRAMEAMKEHKYEVARITLQTLINTYPDSEFVARAKLTVGESWYQEGGTAALAQAETEFRDFITFFPNMAEASEAQLKIADIHYRQMEKPDRDFTHARRAEEEYRQLLLQYPDSKLADTARIRLLQVQEVMAERQFRIQRFYLLRGSFIASIARGRTLTDTYPLYSHSDEALFLLGQAYERQGDRTRIAPGLPEPLKQKLVKEYLDSAAQVYSKIVTRYPAMPRYQDARRRLTAIDRPVPTPTPEAIAQNKKEVASRTAETRYERFVSDMGKRPDLTTTIKTGQPTLVDPKETDAPHLVRELNTTVANAVAASKGGKSAVTVETVKPGDKVPESQPAPRSAVAPTPAAKPAVNPSDVPAEAPKQLNEAKIASTTDDKPKADATKPDESSSTKTAEAASKDSASSRKAKKKFKVKLPVKF
jgi:outer membrane protein assembly factor BamD